MTIKDARKKLERLLSIAGINIGGDRSWDIHVHNDEFYPRVLCEASLGLGESYMDGWWDCERLDEFFYRVLKANLDTKVQSWREIACYIKFGLLNLQKPSRAFKIGQHHYDIGNDLYRVMLDKNMIYSCGYWKNASSLDQAQEAKLDLVCKKLMLQPGMKVLDIGCGWGGTAKFAAEHYNVEVVGITVSEEQVFLGRELCKDLPVNIRLQDYRNLDETFDRILSIGMFEHVGVKNYRTFFHVVRKCLKEDGLFLLHTIGRNLSSGSTDPWVERYIFPNSILPSPRQICDAIEGQFVIEDWHNFGIDYNKTLLVWHKNFCSNWEKLKEKYDERFLRMWKYYLLSFAGAFEARKIHVWQIVLSPKGVEGGYQSLR